MTEPSPKEVVAITGGAGFLGAHLVRHAIHRGHHVRLLLRPKGSRAALEGLPLDIVEADLDHDSELPPEFVRGARWLFHLAARYAEGEEHSPALLRTNLGGTERVLSAAHRGGVQRVIHVSTMGTCVPRGLPRSATEQDFSGDDASAYVRSKAAGELAALSMPGLDVVVVNPAAPVGAFDGGRTVTGRRLLDIRAGRFPHLFVGPVNYVPATSVAEALFLAAEHGRSKERYLIGGANLGPGEFLRRAAAGLGVPVPTRTWIDRLLRRRALLPGQLAIDDTKARRDLGYVSGDLDQAFREAR